MDTLKDVGTAMGNNLKKSAMVYSKDVSRFAQSFSESLNSIDLSDLRKSIHEVTNPEDHARRKSSVVHKPIDWSKKPPLKSQQSMEVNEGENVIFDEQID